MRAHLELEELLQLVHPLALCPLERPRLDVLVQQRSSNLQGLEAHQAPLSEQRLVLEALQEDHPQDLERYRRLKGEDGGELGCRASGRPRSESKLVGSHGDGRESASREEMSEGWLSSLEGPWNARVVLCWWEGAGSRSIEQRGGRAAVRRMKRRAHEISNKTQQP